MTIVLLFGLLTLGMSSNASAHEEPHCQARFPVLKGTAIAARRVVRETGKVAKGAVIRTLQVVKRAIVVTDKVVKGPLIVYNYPKEIKSFYMRLNDDEKTVRAMDILFPGIGEIVGGSQREEREDILKKRMKAIGIEEKELWWYQELRKYGTAIHSGFGLGFERLVMFVTGMSNIRDVIPFPRTPQNAEF